MYQLVINSPNSFSAADEFFTVSRAQRRRRRSVRKAGQQDQAGDDDAGKIDDKKGAIHVGSLRRQRLKPLTCNGRAPARFLVENSHHCYNLLLIRGANMLEGAHETATSLSDRGRIWLCPSPFPAIR
jgi:hypothetical protein